MSDALNHLIAEARGLANDHPCDRDHAWISIGGCHCPECDGSRAVYECARCGECDYGERVPCGHECDRGRALVAEFAVEEAAEQERELRHARAVIAAAATGEQP
jgi:hypothetical protein